MKKAGVVLAVAALFLGTSQMSFCESREQQKVTRVDTVTVTLKHHTLAIDALGMCKTPSAMNRGGRLIRRGAQPVLNKDGLLEYDMVFNGVPNYTGFKLRPVRATLHERSVPAGVKGVRVFAEFNEADGLLPEPKKPASILPFGKKKERKPTLEESATLGGTPAP